MLTSGAQKNSTTENELLAALGEIGTIESLNQYYSKLLTTYKVL